MNRFATIFITFFISFFLVSSAHAEIKVENFHITPFVGGYTFDGADNLDTSPVVGFRLGYDITKRWGLEGIFEYVRAEVKGGSDKAHVTGYRLEAVYNFMTEGKLVPFVALGAGGRSMDSVQPLHDRNHFLLDYGVGLKYFISDKVALRGDIRHLLLMNDRLDNLEYTVGLTYYFGEKKPPAKIEVTDTDRDGVPNDMDKCPGTPLGVRVDKDGCPPDSDGDGVRDYMDKCPGTPKGVKVDKDGCPPDSDGDGVPDYLDKCSDTPKGVKVDKNGCPLDSDGDGVPDYLDKCPASPKGVKVDKDGCPVVEKPPEVKPVPPPKKKEKTTAAALVAKEMFEKGRATINIEFDFDKSVVKPRYHGEIEKFADVMKTYRDLNVIIEGHTDWTGTEAYNQKLSERRAGSVKKYMVEKFGVESSRLSTKGYGESKPIASNKTAAGRRQNRRVEAVVDYMIKK